MTKSSHSLIRIDTEHYGWIVSRHLSADTADRAYERKAALIVRHNPKALPRLMYVVSAITGRVGDRVRYA